MLCCVVLDCAMRDMTIVQQHSIEELFASILIKIFPLHKKCKITHKSNCTLRKSQLTKTWQLMR